MDNFRVAHRGGVGVRTIPTDKRNGKVIGLAVVNDNSSVLLIDAVGKIIRLAPTEIRTMGRQAKGVRLIKLDAGQKLSSVVAFEEQADNNNDNTHNDNGTVRPSQKAAVEQSVTDILDMQVPSESTGSTDEQSVFEPAQAIAGQKMVIKDNESSISDEDQKAFDSTQEDDEQESIFDQF